MSENESIHKQQVLILNDKSKEKKKESNFAVKKINNDNETHRADAYGTLINHKNRRNVKVTFRDKIDDNKGTLAEIIDVENYKKYNYMETLSTLSEREAFDKERSCCCSCFIV